MGGNLDDRHPKDWFIEAIETDGSVDLCLETVSRALKKKSTFIDCLRTCLRSKDEGGVDAVTALSNRLKLLENSLRFRLGMLRPERPAPWFRPPVSTTLGPFASTMLREPIFAAFPMEKADQVRTALDACWRGRHLQDVPFQNGEDCLWRKLLEFNAELELICCVGQPYHDLRLDELPETLPPALESRALRAFLLNVRGEVLSVRHRLEACYAELRGACEGFWQHLQEQSPRQRRRAGFAHNRAADDMRETFRQRRQFRERPSPFGLGADGEALQYMGFSDYPEHSELRRRYLELAKKLHPDRNGGSQESFATLTRAYQRLSGRARSR